MNYPTRQQRYAWPGARLAILAAVLVGLLAQVGVARAATDAWLAAETAATLEITAPDSQVETDDTGPVVLGPAWSPRLYVARVGLGRPWQPSALRIRPDRIGRSWQSRPFRAARVRPGRQLADVRKDRWPDAPELGDIAVYLPRAVLAAKAEQWDVLAAQMQPFGIDPNAVAQVAPEQPKAAPSMDASFGGELDPSWSAGKLAKRIKKMKSFGFTVPVVPVRSLQRNWRTKYDGFFEAIGDGITPMLGLCVGKMDVPDLLAVPEFLRRYEGKYHSVIVNYDLTNGHVDGMQGPPAFRAAAERVSLALALTKRATPAVYAWLAVGYNRAPTWNAWASAFDRQQFSGLMLSGHSAVSACMNPQIAKQIQRQIGKRFPNTQIGLVNFRLHTLDWLMFHRDDLGIQRYSTIRAQLKQVGIVPLHIRYTAGH